VITFLAWGVLLPPAAAGLAGLFLVPDHFPPQLVLSLLMAASLGILLAVRGGPWRGKLLLALLPLGLLLWPEVGLRLAGFTFQPKQIVQFGFPTREDMVYLEPDPDLFWRYPPEPGRVNSAGFPGEEFPTGKPPHRWRMVFLGDSCTQQGYPELVASYLTKRVGSGVEPDAVNLGLVGYSSYQGLVLARRWVEPLAPDLGVITFGWNDHWLAFGRSDAEKAAALFKPYHQLPRLWSISRVAQWVIRAASIRNTVPTGKLRVSPEEYRANLIGIGEQFERAGSAVLLVTSPTSFATRGVPAKFVEEGFATSKDRALTLHRQYNQVVREVAELRGWYLADLAAAAAELSEPSEVFMQDGVHFTEPGVRWVASLLADAILQQFLRER
jgi:lysophospholipase L1-like esterase